MAGASLFVGGNLSEGVCEDRGNLWVIAAFASIGLLDAYLPAWSDRNGVWSIDGDAVRWLGVLLFTAGGALRLWPVVVLGPRFSGLVAIQPGHTLAAASWSGLNALLLGANLQRGNIFFRGRFLRASGLIGVEPSDVYEYFIGQFAAAEGKKGGQFYTPSCVVELGRN